MSRFADPERRIDRVPVPNLADHHHIRIGTQHRTERVVKGSGVAPHLPLRDECPPIPMDDLHRVLDGDDVHRARAVDPVQDGRHRGGFARADRTGGEDESGSQSGQCRRARRQTERIERRHLARHHPVDGRERPAAPEHTAAEAGHSRQGERIVGLSALLEQCALAIRNTGGHHRLHDLRGQRLAFRLGEPAVDPEPGRGARTQVQIAPPAADQFPQKPHELLPGIRRGRRRRGRRSFGHPKRSDEISAQSGSKLFRAENAIAAGPEVACLRRRSIRKPPDPVPDPVAPTGPEPGRTAARGAGRRRACGPRTDGDRLVRFGCGLRRPRAEPGGPSSAPLPVLA